MCPVEPTLCSQARTVPSTMSHSQPNLNNLSKGEGVRQLHQAQMITVNNNDNAQYVHSNPSVLCHFQLSS
jgi:hypothetical protein